MKWISSLLDEMNFITINYSFNNLHTVWPILGMQFDDINKCIQLYNYCHNNDIDMEHFHQCPDFFYNSGSVLHWAWTLGNGSFFSAFNLWNLSSYAIWAMIYLLSWLLLFYLIFLIFCASLFLSFYLNMVDAQCYLNFRCTT